MLWTRAPVLLIRRAVTLGPAVGVIAASGVLRRLVLLSRLEAHGEL